MLGNITDIEIESLDDLKDGDFLITVTRESFWGKWGKERVTQYLGSGTVWYVDTGEYNWRRCNTSTESWLSDLLESHLINVKHFFC